MRKLIAGMKISVDGKLEGSEGTPDAANRRVRAWGRHVRYERYWTAIQNEPDKPAWITGSAPTPAEIEWARFAARTPHYLLSCTLTSVLWPNTSFARGFAEIATPQQESGKDIYLVGGAQAAADELRIIIYPLIAGVIYGIG